MQSRNALFELTMLWAIALICLAVIAIGSLAVQFAPSITVNLISKMPIFYNHTVNQDGTVSYPLENLSDTTPQKTELVVLYDTILVVALTGLLFVILIGFIGLPFEDLGLIQKDTAKNILIKTIIVIPLFIALPVIWDLIAISIHNLTIFLFNPANPSDPYYYPTIVFSKVGNAIEFDSVKKLLDWDEWFSKVLDPGLLVQTVLTDFVFILGKSILVISVLISMFIVYSVKFILLLILLVMFPIIYILDMLPWFKWITKSLYNSFTGLVIASLFAAIVFPIAGTYFVSAQDPPLEEWFMGVGVIFLVLTIPIVFSPLLGSLVSQTQRAFDKDVLDPTFATVGSAVTSGGIGAIRSALQKDNDTEESEGDWMPSHSPNYEEDVTRDSAKMDEYAPARRVNTAKEEFDDSTPVSIQTDSRLIALKNLSDACGGEVKLWSESTPESPESTDHEKINQMLKDPNTTDHIADHILRDKDIYFHDSERRRIARKNLQDAVLRSESIAEEEKSFKI